MTDALLVWRAQASQSGGIPGPADSASPTAVVVEQLRGELVAAEGRAARLAAELSHARERYAALQQARRQPRCFRRVSEPTADFSSICMLTCVRIGQDAYFSSAAFGLLFTPVAQAPTFPRE